MFVFDFFFLMGVTTHHKILGQKNVWYYIHRLDSFFVGSTTGD